MAGKQVSISQCMIAKNEESNIGRALSWGKGIVCEQIVVDTGSVDRTVEIAESMSARVFHLEWRDDFAAAKNFAIEQAKGDWIAFLDADEYLTDESARKLPELLRKIDEADASGRDVQMISALICHLDDAGKVFATGHQERIFRNDPALRYKNRIHEEFYRTDGRKVRSFSAVDELSIMHTGYQKKRNEEKAEQTIHLLKKELQEDPDDYNMWAYLGDAYVLNGQFAEAWETMKRVMDGGMGRMDPERRILTFSQYFRLACVEREHISIPKEELLEYYKRFSYKGIVMPDVEFFLGKYFLQDEDREAALFYFEEALKKLERYHSSAPLYLTGSLDYVYRALAVLYIEKRDVAKAVQYATYALRRDRYQLQPLLILLKLFQEDVHTTMEQEFAFLEKLYHLEQSKDRLYLMAAAKKVGDKGLEQKIGALMPAEEKEAMRSMEPCT